MQHHPLLPCESCRSLDFYVREYLVETATSSQIRCSISPSFLSVTIQSIIKLDREYPVVFCLVDQGLFRELRLMQVTCKQMLTLLLYPVIESLA
jgi:hypothetical protein